MGKSGLMIGSVSRDLHTILCKKIQGFSNPGISGESLKSIENMKNPGKILYCKKFSFWYFRSTAGFSSFLPTKVGNKI